MAKMKLNNMLLGILLVFLVIGGGLGLYVMFIEPNFNGAPQLNTGSIIGTGTNPTQAPTTGGQGTTGAGAPITISAPFMIFNATTVTQASTCPAVVALHTDGTSLIGATTSSSSTITGALTNADNGQFWLLVRGQGTTYGVLEAATAQQGNIISGSRQIMNYQGYVWTAYRVNAGSEISTGYSTTVNIIGFQCDNTPKMVSYLNQTGMTTTTTANAQTTVYLSGTSFTYGQGAKVARIQVTLPNSGNVSAYDAGNLKLGSITVNWGNGQGSQVYTNVGILNGAGTTSGYVEIPLNLADTQNSASAQPWMYGQQDTNAGLSITFNWQAKLTGASDVFCPSAKVYLLDPTSTSSTMTVPMQIGA